MTLFFLLLVLWVGHFVADYTLQPDFVQRGKNRNHKPDLSKIPAGQKLVTIWPWVLTSHAATHAAAVLLLTFNAWFMLAEWVLHWLIDYHKTGNTFGPHTDQSLHLACKVLYVAVIAAGFAPVPEWFTHVTI